MVSVAIIDYGSGNLRSVAKAFERMAAQGGSHVLVTSDPEDLETATHIVLPGVGAFADCMGGLQKMPGMIAGMERQVLQKKKPFLGICVGMQMLFETGLEHGTHQGLGWLAGEVVKIDCRLQLKIPHMGWNEITPQVQDHPLLADIHRGDHCYFVHSYHALCKDPADILATTDYGTAITAIVGRGNIMGTQFHPEKSQETGLKLIRNFLA